MIRRATSVDVFFVKKSADKAIESQNGKGNQIFKITVKSV